MDDQKKDEVQTALEISQKALEKMTTAELIEEVKKLNVAHERYTSRLTQVGKSNVEYGMCIRRILETNRSLAALCVYLLELK